MDNKVRETIHQVILMEKWPLKTYGIKVQVSDSI